MDASLWQHPVVRGAVAGLLTAAAVDFQAFRKWQAFSDALAYNWSTALFRWAQGAVIGAASAVGFGMVG